MSEPDVMNDIEVSNPWRALLYEVLRQQIKSAVEVLRLCDELDKQSQ